MSDPEYAPDVKPHVAPAIFASFRTVRQLRAFVGAPNGAMPWRRFILAVLAGSGVSAIASAVGHQTGLVGHVREPIALPPVCVALE